MSGTAPSRTAVVIDLGAALGLVTLFRPAKAVMAAEFELIKDKTIGQLFEQTCKKNGIQEAIVCPKENVQLTFMTLRIEVEKLAAGLLLTGLNPGDHVLLWGANHANLIHCIYACAKAGLVFSCINPAAPKEMVAKFITKGDFRAVVCFPTLKPGSSYQMLVELCPELKTDSKGRLKSKELTKLSHVIMAEEEHKYPGTYTLTEIFGLSKAEHISKLNDLKQPDPNSLAALQFTMGTTNNPKAVMLSHFQLINACLVAGKRLYFDQPGEILCCPMPVFRGPVMCLAVLATAVFGIKVVYPSPLPLPPAVFQAIETQKCTILISNPIAFHLMLRLPNLKNFNIQSLTSVCLVGENLQPDLIASLQTSTKITDVTTGLFMTEFGCLPFLSPADGNPTKLMTSQGKVAAHFEAKMVDLKGREVGPGVIGQLCIKPIGGSDFLGYYKDEKITMLAYEHKWLQTGDVGTLDADGYFAILGQQQDIIYSGDQAIYPWKLEKALSSHPSVLAVQVVDVPGAKETQICACAVVKDKGNGEIDEDLLRQQMNEICAEQKMTEPNYIVFVKDFPRTPTRKVQKHKLKTMVQNFIKEQYVTK